MNQGYLEVGFK